VTYDLKDLGIKAVPPGIDPTLDTVSLCFYVANANTFNQLQYLPPDVINKYRNGIMACPLENVRAVFLNDGQMITNAYYVDSLGKLRIPAEPNEIAFILGDKNEDQSLILKRLSTITTWLSHLNGDTPLNIMPVLMKGDSGKKAKIYTDASQVPVYMPDGQVDLSAAFPEANLIPAPPGYYLDPETGEVYYAGESAPTMTPTPTPTPGPSPTPTPTPTFVPTPTPGG